MNLNLSAEEICIICVMAWPGPLPPFKGVSGILPQGIKNKIKWKSKIGLRNLAKKEQKKLQKDKIWNTDEFENIMQSILFFDKCIILKDEEKYIMSFFVSEEGFSSIEFIEKGDKYCISNYKDKYVWKKEIDRHCLSTEYHNLHLDCEYRDKNGKTISKVIRKSEIMSDLEI